MRSSKSRSRNKNNRNRSVGNVVNRVFDSSGPEGKVRGTPQQIIDKYNQLARDAQLSNDRVATENFQQHAEHYLRMLAEAQKEQAERQAQQQQQQNENRQRRNQADEQAEPAGSGEQPEPQPSVEADAGEGRRDRRRKPKSDDVIDFDRNEASGLVETPEEKPQRPRRSRRKPEDETTPAKDAAPSESAPTPDAAE